MFSCTKKEEVYFQTFGATEPGIEIYLDGELIAKASVDKYLELFEVVPEKRGYGYGRAVMEWMYESMGGFQIDASFAALEFYKKLGYTPVCEDYVEKFNNYPDKLMEELGERCEYSIKLKK